MYHKSSTKREGLGKARRGVLVQSRNKPTPPCEQGMKCKDNNCQKSHPLCKNDSKCKEAKCGFSHSDGRRYTGAKTTPNVPSFCWKKQKCNDPMCQEPHPKCSAGILCKNTKCGFVHPNGWRYVSIPTYFPVVESSQNEPLRIEGAIDPYGIYAEELSDVRTLSLDQRPYVPSAIEVAKYVIAKGVVSRINEEKSTAWMTPTSLPQFAKHHDFYTAISNCPSEHKISISLVHESTLVRECLVAGDSITANVFMDRFGHLHANSVEIKRVDFLARKPDDLKKLVLISTAPSSMCDGIIRLILLNRSLTRDAICQVLLYTQWAWTDSTQLTKATRLYSIIRETSFLCPGGCFHQHLCGTDGLKDNELIAACDMIGCICMLDPRGIPSLLQVVKRIASLLGERGVGFLGDILQIVAISMAPDTALSSFEWWQLPNVPTEQEISVFESSYGVTDMKSLPSVMVGKEYSNASDYLSTYMRLHRADCFLPFVQSIQHHFHEGRHHGDISDAVILERVTACGVQLSASNGDLNFQLQCTVQNPSALRLDSLSLENTVCVSLQGDFKDDHLLWGVISTKPSKLPRLSSITNDTKPYPVVFGIRWCTYINHISDEEVFLQLNSHQQTVRMMENSISFVSSEPILNALRSYWRPGRTLAINFQETLLSGKPILAKPVEKETLLKHAREQGVFDRLNDSQKEAFYNVAKHSFALIQGPPGCGKSYVGSQLVKILAQQYKKILISTSKNHSLDEILIDVSRSIASDGTSKVVRVGNEKKIATELKPSSLSALLASFNDALNASPEQKAIEQLSRKFRSASKRLQERVCLRWSNFEATAGYQGTRSLLRNICASNELTSFQTAPPDVLDLVDAFLYQWSEPIIAEIIHQSKAYWSRSSSSCLDEVESTTEGDVECDLGDIRPDSLLGVVTSFGIASSCAISLQDIDASFIWSCGEESKKHFILSVLHNEFRAIIDQLIELSTDLPRLKEAAKDLRAKKEIDVIQTASIIGSTVLGTLLNIDVISAARPDVLVFEEAAEVSESALISILRIPSLKRIVLIGDHLQLRPAVNCHELRVQKKYDVSCFERLVSLNMPCTMLTTQSRMRPDVLLPVQLHYPGIHSNSSLDLPQVDWLGSALFWWTCEEPGEKMHSSWYNKEQGHRSAELALFLVNQQATLPQRITILVPYSSHQMFVQNLLRGKGCEEVIDSTIDQYQGDENDIIILNLVRCAPDDPSKIGFLQLSNRMIVATSRQKLALIIIGSETCFGTSQGWKRLQDELRHSGKIGQSLPLCCPRHPTKIIYAKDSTRLPRDGCGTKCGMSLSCSHLCTSQCHPKDLHGKCKSTVNQCYSPCNHEVQFQCHAVQKLCPTRIAVKLECGHEINTTCGRYHSPGEPTLECSATSEFTLPCAHSVYLRCGSSIEGFVSPEFNSCPECIVPAYCRKKISSRCLAQNEWKSAKSRGEISTVDSQMITDAVFRENLCSPDLLPALERAIKQARLPIELLQLSIPGDFMWDSTISNEEKRSMLEQFTRRQQLWHVLLQETGCTVPRDWQRNPLSMIAALAIDSDENKRTWNKRSGTMPTKAETFYQRLCQLEKMEIKTAAELIDLLKKADDCLYTDLSQHESSKDSWYDKMEGKLAQSVTAVLLARSAAARSGGAYTSTVQRFMSDCRGSEAERQSSLNKVRSIRKLPSQTTFNLESPPYTEVPQEFLYQPALQGMYISIDLKSADFYILRMASPMISAATWEDWVNQTISNDIASKLPFISELKALRVRVPGKVLHKKNAILQYHCIRILVRLLLALAVEDEKSCDCIDRVFQFSCDELCIKLKDGTELCKAGLLHKILTDLFDDAGWADLMPVRIEIFSLSMVAITDENQKKTNAVDPSLPNEIHPGHPALRRATQFVDLPAIHDPAWEKPKVPMYENSGDFYFARRVYDVCELNSARYNIELKLLSKSLRPYAILQFLSTLEDTDEDESCKLSTAAKEFVPAAKKLSPCAQLFSPRKALSSTASEFIPSSETNELSSNAKEFSPRI